MVINYINIDKMEYVNTDTLEVLRFETFAELMESMCKVTNIAYIYGLDKLDKVFCKWCFDKEYKHISSGENNGVLDGKQFQVLSSYGENTVVKIRIKPTKGRQITILDAKKIFGKYNPQSIAQKMGTTDLNFGMAYAINDMRGRGFTGMTLSQNAFKDMRVRAYGKQFFHLDFEEDYPKLNDGIHNFIFDSFQGGLTVINQKYIGQHIKERGITLDVNSMYPFIMREKFLPFGAPIAFEGRYKKERRYPFYFQMISINKLRIKEDGIDCIKVRSRIRRANLGCYKNADNIILVLNNIDMEMLFDNYNVEGIEYLGGFMFQGKKRTFENFINYWEEEKIEGEIKGDTYRKMIAKMFLNNAFGKFVSRNNRVPCNYKQNSKGKVVKSIYTEGDRFTGSSIYCPFGCFITSYGRQMLLKIIKQNREHFLYADTDSGHFLVDDHKKLNLTGVDIDQSRFGAWKVENKWTEAKFLGKKQYIEKIEDGTLKVVCAGLPPKLILQVQSVEDFEYGKEFDLEIKKYDELGISYIEKTKYVLKDEIIV